MTSTLGPALGGIGRGGRMVLPPQKLQSQANLQPSTPVPSSSLFQQTFASQATQSMAPGGLQPAAPMAMAFGRGIILPMGAARGQQMQPTPMDTSSTEPMQPGGLQQAQGGTPLSRPILGMPTEPVPPPPPPPPARVVFDRDSGHITYYRSDASAALLFQQTQQTQQTDWSRDWRDTHSTQ